MKRKPSTSTSTSILTPHVLASENKGEHRKDYMVDRLSVDNELLRICEKKGIAPAKGSPVNVTYHRPSHVYLQQTGKLDSIIKGIEYTVDENGKVTKKTKNENNKIRLKFRNVPFKYVYYTESDQILKYGSPMVMDMLVSATNESTMLAGRRRNKDAQSNASEYMSGEGT